MTTDLGMIDAMNSLPSISELLAKIPTMAIEEITALENELNKKPTMISGVIVLFENRNDEKAKELFHCWWLKPYQGRIL